jgi:hypothetical protein
MFYNIECRREAYEAAMDVVAEREGDAGEVER